MKRISTVLISIWIGVSCAGPAVIVPGDGPGGSSPPGLEPGPEESANIYGTTIPPEWSRPAIPIAPDVGTIQSELDACDGRDDEGRFGEQYAVDLHAGQRIRVWVTSTEIDPMLMIFGPESFALESDDLLPGTLFPMVQFEAPSAGIYTIRVTGFSAGDIGPYMLGVLPVGPASSADRLTLGDRYQGITRAGGAGPGLRTGDSHWLDVRGGERLVIRLTSQVFDTVAILFGPQGQVWINDDANDVGEDGSERPLDSTLSVFAPQDGLYHLLVASYGDTGGGAYQIRGRTQPPIILLPGEEVPQRGYAGGNGDGRIYGLFVGITQYRSMGTLYGCGDDARFLAQAFRERGLQSPEQQVVLIDDQATRSAFLDSLRTLLVKTGPQDVLVLFFSGHGNNHPTVSGDPLEFDGTDESIVLIDGEVLDNEVANLLRGAAANLVVVAVDACHSGGFAQDLIVQPNVMGLFSSDEDILSDTAETLGAGGYLSYYLRRAVLGEADTRPKDGALMVGELTDFIYRGFLTSNDDMNPPGSNDPMQRLVMRRGSVRWDHLLWIYPRQPDGSLPPIPDLPLRSPEPKPDEEVIAPTTCGCRTH